MGTTISQLTQASASEITTGSQLIWQTEDGNTRRVLWSDLETTLMGSRYTTSLVVSSAEILALGATPLDYVYGTTTYAANTNLQVLSKGVTVPQYQLDMLGATVSTIRQFADHTATGATDVQLSDNTAVVLQVETGNPTTGDGTLTIYATYDIITL